MLYQIFKLIYFLHQFYQVDFVIILIFADEETGLKRNYVTFPTHTFSKIQHLACSTLSTSLELPQMCSFLQLSNIPLCRYHTPLSIHLPMASRLLPCPSYCKQCYNEHWGICVSFNYGFLSVYAQQWDCRVVTLQIYYIH